MGSGELKVITKKMLLDRMFIENDLSDHTLFLYRGKSNQSAYVHYIAEHIAELGNTDVETMATTTTDNYFKLFSLAKRPASFDL